MRIRARDADDFTGFEPGLEPAYTPEEDVNLQNGEDESYAEPVEDEKAPPTPKKRIETSKLIVLLCLLNGFLWVWCSYLLAWFGRDQIAESLSQVALTEIIAVVLTYAVKSLFENLSKNNDWPDRPDLERK